MYVAAIVKRPDGRSDVQGSFGFTLASACSCLFKRKRNRRPISLS